MLSIKVFCTFLYRITVILVFFFSFIVSAEVKSDAQLKTVIDNYIKVYNERSDLESFLKFYHPDAQLLDIINGDIVLGKANLKKFFDWENPHLNVDKGNSLVVTSILTSNNEAVLSGYYLPFSWHDKKYEAMHFISKLEFNDDKLIVKHIDWINYPSDLVDYSKRKNSNDWIKLEN